MNTYLAILSRQSVSAAPWLMPRELLPEFVRASTLAHLRADIGIACWEWDHIYQGMPL